jgi:RNA recognition motif-containing protein
MSTKLYVGGIPYTSTEQSMKDAFSKAGTVLSSSIIIDRMTGRSKGFGFIEMENDEAAQAAINMWNGMDFEGRKLTVNVARPLEPRAPGMGGNRRPM